MILFICWILKNKTEKEQNRNREREETGGYSEKQTKIAKITKMKHGHSLVERISIVWLKHTFAERVVIQK